MPYTGTFVIADISGYTRLMAQANLEQSQAVVGGLMATLLGQIRLPLIVSRLEGDAVFCYAPDGSFLQGQTLLEVIDSLYYSFRQAMELEDHNTDCDCQACGLRPSLDLKIIVHYGPGGARHQMRMLNPGLAMGYRATVGRHVNSDVFEVNRGLCTA